MLSRDLLKARELSTIVLLVLVVVCATIREPRFLQPTSIESILLWVPMLVVVGIGQMMVIVTRGIDVSVGSMVGLAGMAVGMLFKSHPTLNVGLGAMAGVGFGLILGAINGGLIAGAKVPPIIATLGTLSAYRGVIFIVSHGVQIDSNNIPDALTNWSIKGPFSLAKVNFPWIFIFAILIATIAGWAMRRTRFGRDVYAVGSQPEAARLRGIAVDRTTFFVYLITGGLCGLAGVMYASRYGFINPASAGQGMELSVIAAVVIGGTPVTGGSGTILGVFLGCLLLSAINVALAVLGIAATWQVLIYGIVILIAVIVDSIVRRAAITPGEAG
jgi:rhamnose transport system permease protein